MVDLTFASLHSPDRACDEFHQLYADVRNLVLRHEWLRGKPDDAQDIAQEAVLEVIRRLRRGKTVEELKGCLGLIAESTRQNWFRKQKRRRPSPQCDSLDVFPARGLSDSNFRELVSAIEDLPGREKLVAGIVWIYGFTIIEAAAILHLHRNTASQLLQRAAQRLSRSLGMHRGKIRESASTAHLRAQ